MKKLTKQQRLDALQNGFYRCGGVTRDHIEDYVLHSSCLTEQLTEQFADSVRENNTKLSIDKIRSNDFIDSEQCHYDFRGKTYQYGQFIIHIYMYPPSHRGTASVLLIAK